MLLAVYSDTLSLEAWYYLEIMGDMIWRSLDLKTALKKIFMRVVMEH